MLALSTCEQGVFYLTDILIIAPTRAELGPLESVIAALPEAKLVDYCWQALDVHATHAIMLGWYTEEFKEQKPRLILLLGDRYETHAAALAAHFLRIPIGHVHGGETTTGAFDDALRHGITHMARLHFVATNDAANRIARLLGRPDGMLFTEYYKDIEVVGAPGLDTIAQGSARRDQKVIVVSYYAETTAADYGSENCKLMLEALEPYAKDHAIFFSNPNSDPGSQVMRDHIQEFIHQFPAAASWITPNTREQYLHLCEHAKFAIGNSSSLVIECPWMGLPSVVVGARQDGRPMANSIFNVGGMHRGPLDLGQSIGAAMTCDVSFHPIYRGGAAPKIAKIVREFVNG